MFGKMKSLASVAVVGFASYGVVVSVAPACEPYGSCHGGYAKRISAPPRPTYFGWTTVYDVGTRPVPAADRAANTIATTTAAKAVATPAAPSNPATSASAAPDRQALASRAEALLKAKCVRCHGETRRSSGLDLRSRESILKGGASGPALIAGQPDASLLLERVRGGEMPPTGGQLSSNEIATLQQWITAGAPAASAQ
jgi:mono/diheme cytochrome c family protein